MTTSGRRMAEKKFAKMKKDKKAHGERGAEEQRIKAKTAQLRALRLAREAANKASAAQSADAKQSSKRKAAARRASTTSTSS